MSSDFQDEVLAEIWVAKKRLLHLFSHTTFKIDDNSWPDSPNHRNRVKRANRREAAEMVQYIKLLNDIKATMSRKEY